MLSGSECWAIKCQQPIITVTEMRRLQRLSEYRRNYKIRNHLTKMEIRILPIKEKMAKTPKIDLSYLFKTKEIIRMIPLQYVQ